jgi:hypothetical protein
MIMNSIKKKIIENVLAAGTISMLLWGCSQEKPADENILASSVDTIASSKKISQEALGDIMKSIPSPLEISSIIRETGGDYDAGLLNAYGNADHYNTSYKKAINLGIYGADMGYINIYNQNKDAISYLSAIKQMADELNIGQFYDFATIRRLASNSNNMDSLLYITTSNFEKINNYLHEKKRSDQSILILTGGWLEALHISCQISQKNDNEKLYEKIGEQKIVLEQLLLLLSNFEEDPNIKVLSNDLKGLQKIYNKIEITYTYHESTMKEVDGVLMIVNESESKVNITPDQVKEINLITENLRNKIVG